MKRIAVIIAGFLLASNYSYAQQVHDDNSMPITGSPSVSPTFAGVTLAPSTGLASALNILQNGSGTTASPFSFNDIKINSDVIDAGANLVTGLTVEHYFGGSAAKGGRSAGAVYGYLTAPTSSSNANRNYVGWSSSITAQTGDGGGASTALTAPVAASGTTAFTVASIAGFNGTDAVSIVLDNGTILQTTVVSAVTLTVTVNGRFPGTATSGNVVRDTTTATNTTLTGTVSATVSTTALTVGAITGFTNADPVALVMDDGTVYTTVISGAPSGNTITILGTLPSASTAGALYNLSVAAPKGALFAYGNNTEAKTGAAGLTEATGAELNVKLNPGSSAKYKAILTLDNSVGDSVQGTTYDVMLGLSAQSNLVGFKNGLLFGPMNGFQPLDPRGCMICTTGSGTIATVLDTSSYAVTGNILNNANSTLTAGGGLILKTAGVQTTKTGGDANGSIVVGPITGGSGTKTPFVNFNTGAANFDARLQADAANQLTLFLNNGANVQRWNTTFTQIGSGTGIPTHIASGQTTAPALTSCGTGSPTISGTDTAGTVTAGTTATGCVITFNVAYTAAPHCVVTWRGTPLISQSYTVSNVAITLTQTSTSGDLVDYICVAPSGG